jgi:hypothetical protein
MPVNTLQNIALSLTLDGTEHNCQVIDVTLDLPGVAPGEAVETACPDGKVSEPGSPSNGSLSGTVYADPSDTGLTWILGQAYKAGSEIAYTITYWADQDNTVAIIFSGQCKVASFSLPFSKPNLAKHPLDLTLITADMARPQAV